MNGILLVNKCEGVTSRDVVNQVCKKLQTRRVGHTGTLDPIATGVMVICVGTATNLVNLLTSEDKEYIAEVTLGIQTDTLDITGNVLREENVNITKDAIENVLNSFLGRYKQEVPIYSAIKVKGKKLYEYARNGEKIILPTRDVEIKEISLLNFVIGNKVKFTFKCLVSKGTYIRSLIRDICQRLEVVGTMSHLVRTKQGRFRIEDCLDIENVSWNNLINMKDVLDIPQVTINKYLQKKVENGQILDNIYSNDKILFLDEEGNALAIYQLYEIDKKKIKPYIMLFNRGGKV